MAYKEKDTKKWTAQWFETNAKGEKKKRRKRGFETKREALEYERQKKLNNSRSMDMKLSEFMEVYFEDKQNELKERTMKNKRYMMEQHIVPYFGNQMMSEITAGQIIQWQNEMQTKGFSEAYLRMIQNQLTSLYTHASKIYDLHANPCKKVKRMGSSDNRSLDFWTIDEYQKFIQTMEPDTRYYLIFEILFWTGCRIGELLALTPKDIDFDKNQISITKTYYRTERQDVITEPKTKQSVRVVEIPEFLKQEIKDFVDRHYGMPKNERNIFTIKDSRFKSDSFLDEVKRSYTDLINIYVKDDKQKLEVFDRNGVYLPTKKIGKNNPKAEQIRTDNQYRTMWNQTVDRALISCVLEEQILEVKQSEIGHKVKASIQKSGRNPALLKSLIMTAIYALELLIGKVFKMASQKVDKGKEAVVNATPEQTPVKRVKSFVKVTSEPLPEMPKKSALASKYSRLVDIYNKLEKQNTAIYEREQQFASVEKELAGTKGIFKAKQRKELQEQAEQLKTQIANMKQYLSSIVQGYGYKNVKEFLAEYRASKEEYSDYQSAVAQ